eukprot:CAMPEP_0195129474 /NCGR_PEP_ID=MMETSP0448-20130528/141243_1 /TAXON_ID=66468 /ORGANISM="Heterocapsa triquestra, Strain CCMP 448" /LENGTH=136 /DNA_ID=CAMNT_0040167317 /DNA_START=14 /DNA_END=420 /DNA_ORIENTATION=+
MAPPMRDPGHPEQTTGPIEAEADLREFLRVVRPDWSLITRGGANPIDRVMAKLKDIGVCNVWELMRKVRANTINMELSAAGHTRFGDDTIELMKSKGAFIRALASLREPYHRQVGVFAPVPQLLAKTNRRGLTESS